MGRTQLVATAILGGWLGITFLMWFVATGSFSTVDRILGRPTAQFTEVTRPMGHDQTRVVLRYLASEINRTCFRAYGWSQIVFGLVLVILLFKQTPRDPAALVISVAMLGLVLVLTWIVTPQIVALGRSIDFVPRDSLPPEMPRFRTLHALFTGLDGLKLLAGLALLVRWIVRG